MNLRQKKTEAGGAWEAVAVEQRRGQRVSHNADKRRRWTQSMWEEKLAGFGDYLDLWREKRQEVKITPTLVTSMALDANIEGVGARRIDNCAGFFACWI